jgi:hypothetical protein
LRSPKDIPIGEVVSGGPPLGRKRIQWKTRIGGAAKK